MNFLDGLKNFLTFVNNNWTSITVIIALVITIALKAKSFFAKSNDEKLEIAKKQMSETVLKLITDAEVDYAEWNKAGSIKRAQVIAKIYAAYPILSKVANQDEVVKYIDNLIDESLKTLREIVSENKEEVENAK